RDGSAITNLSTPYSFTIDTNSQERMRITNTGNVGIGTTSPGAKLEVNSGGGIHISDDAAGRTLIIRPSLSGAVHEFTSDNTAAGYAFSNNSSEFMRITNTGNVGIGTTNPSTKLEVITAANEEGIAIKDTSGNLKYKVRQFGGNTYSNFWNASNQSQVQISAGGTTYFNGGSVGIGTTSPASKLAVDGGDIEVDDSANGLILRSPNGTRYRIKVDNSGNLTTTAQ
ncbi:MAG: hypothetical protein GY787_20355, partial [Alteromonadales bacterium]|nr:hypothetical protein [Alteromonadales bacterium]